jgi:hypothetical protein
VNIEGQITAALDGRAEQRPFVDRLAAQWTQLAGLVDGLRSAGSDLSHLAAAAQTPEGEHATLFGDLARYLGDGSDWQRSAADLAVKLADSSGQVRVLHARVNRETVNIGVLGVTGAGKSTLLRKLSGLGIGHIPSNKYDSSTATPSRIFHESAAGDGRAVLHLHTWESFREEVLTPLHEKAKIGQAAPLTADDFRRFRYPEGVAAEGDAGIERYLRRLRTAQLCLPSYQSLLRGGTEQVTLADLRPYVAYPENAAVRDRPYHAVQSVDIFCAFPRLPAVRLGLVDLPGSGEAGLDVHGRFLTGLRNEADLVFIVKRPTQSRGDDQDWDVAALADAAAAGVRRADFAHLVINHDQGLPSDYFERYADKAIADAEDALGISTRICDIELDPPDKVTADILGPTLEHIARRLRDMDRDAIAFVLAQFADICAQAGQLADDLTRHLDGGKRHLADEDKTYREDILKLTYKISANLQKLIAEYDEQYRSQAPIEGLAEEISDAGQAVRQWLADGLGAKSTEEWLSGFENAIIGRGLGHALDQRYNGARREVVEHFSRIDASLHAAIEKLWGEVAAALRKELTDAIIPQAADGAADLDQFAEVADAAEGHGAPNLSEATRELRALQRDYGSIFLRVGRPIVRRIWWEPNELAPQATQSAPPPAQSAPPPRQAAEDDDDRWWEWDEPQAAPAGPAAPSSSASAQSAQSVPPASNDPLAAKYPRAWNRYVDLCSMIESVTSELEDRFHEEARRTLLVLAAAVDKYVDSTVTKPGIEVEWERVCRPAQREIWPEKFTQGAANITAAMAALRQQAAVTAAAAGETTAVIDQARRL